MSNQNFIDYVKINGKSGRGGPGSHSYFRDNLTQKVVQTVAMGETVAL